MTETFSVEINELASICKTLPSSIRIAANVAGFTIAADDWIDDFEVETLKSNVFHARLAKLPTNEAQRLRHDLMRQWSHA
jgi:hypothetical protein